MATTVFNIAKSRLLSGDLDLNADTVKVILIEGTVSIDDTDDDVAEVLAAMAEFSGTNYTPGGSSTDRKTISMSGAVAVDHANHRAVCTFPATSWTAINGGTINAVLYYEHIGTNDAANFPIMVCDDNSGLPLPTNGSDVSLAASVLRLT